MHAGALDGRDMDEHIRAAILRCNKPVALGAVEELYGSNSHDDLLINRHRNPTPGRMPNVAVVEIERGISSERFCAKTNFVSKIDAQYI
jgi:hypothetical protein